MKVAIVGTGMIGTDLLIKAMRSPLLTVDRVLGRRADSPGVIKARELGVRVYLEDGTPDPDQDNSCYTWMIASNAEDSQFRFAAFGESAGECKCQTIDLTPCRIGELCVPAWNLKQAVAARKTSLISCGAQASIPLLAAAWSAMDEPIEYVEVISSIASKSAGPATRANIDEYIHRTEAAIKQFTGAPDAKAVLILNPADPPVDMQTTIRISPAPKELEWVHVEKAISKAVERVQEYVPGYELRVPMTFDSGGMMLSVRVRGQGDWLPPYAGNLDIITSAAIQLAEAKARANGHNP